MKLIKRYIKVIKDFFYDHPTLRVICEYTMATIGAFLSAFTFAFGYRAFVDPILPNAVPGQVAPVIVTGGASGIGQIIVKIFELCGFNVNSMVGNLYWHYLIQSASYVLVNIPVFYLSFKKVGPKFGVFTILNVLFYFIINNYMPKDLTSMFYTNPAIHFENDLLSRSIFAGICTGLAAIISFKFDHSTGGIDAVSVYVNEKKGNFSIGRVTLIINACIVITYTILCVIGAEGTDLSSTTLALYSCVYFFTSSTVIDTFTKRDKKSQLQIITSRAELPDVLINYFPHSCTTVKGEGAYSKSERLIVYTVISKFEVKRALKIIKEIDPYAFIVINNVNQVSGRFFIRPHK